MPECTYLLKMFSINALRPFLVTKSNDCVMRSGHVINYWLQGVGKEMEVLLFSLLATIDINSSME
jgi:hypothetical protein